MLVPASLSLAPFAGRSPAELEQAVRLGVLVDEERRRRRTERRSARNARSVARPAIVRPAAISPVSQPR